MKINLIVLCLFCTLSVFGQKNLSLIDNIRIYQKYLSNSWGGDCMMHPSCSNYAINAFNIYKPIKAFHIVSDRLQRCGHDTRFYSPVIISGNYKFKDMINSTVNNEQIQYYAYSNLIYANNSSFNTNRTNSLDFAKYLIENKEYNIALRICYEEIFNGSANWKAYYYYMLCLKNEQSHNKIIYDFDVLFPQEIKNQPEIIFELANIYLGINNYLYADSLCQIVIHSNNSFLADKAHLMSGYCNARLDRFEDSLNSFKKIKSESYFYGYSRDNIDLINDLKNYKPKNSSFAGVLGIVPGLGYLYSGHKQTAFTALLVNTLLAYATYTSFKTDNYGIGALTGFFSLSFYIGNIYGGIRSANRHNTYKQNEIFNQFKLAN